MNGRRLYPSRMWWVKQGQNQGRQGPRRIKHDIFFQVRDLEERLVEKEHELTQMKRNLDESEGAIAQVTHCVCSSPTFSPSSLFPFCAVDRHGCDVRLAGV